MNILHRRELVDGLHNAKADEFVFVITINNVYITTIQNEKCFTINSNWLQENISQILTEFPCER